MKVDTALTATVLIKAEEGDQPLAIVTLNANTATSVAVRMVEITYTTNHRPSLVSVGRQIKRDGTLGVATRRDYGFRGNAALTALVREHCPEGFKNVEA